MLQASQISWVKNQKNILQAINLKIAPGECLGLIGPNGSGKSSLLKILAFLERPSSGELWFQGKLMPKRVPLDIRRRLAIVFQDALLLDTNVWENVALGLKLRGLPQKEIKERVQHWLSQFGVLHLAQQPARSLSGGEAQRVSLARALVLEPAILFLDEPFSALDAPTKEALRVDLDHVFKTTQLTTVLVSHDFEDIQRLTQRAILLLKGKIAADAPPSELLTYPQNPDVQQFIAHWQAPQSLNSVQR